MHFKNLIAAAVLAAGAGAALAQDQSIYIGGAFIDLHSSAPALSGPPGTTPPDARLKVDDASTVVFGYNRYFTDNWGIDLVLGIPPEHKVKGQGALEAFGQISSSKQVAPTLFANYRFGKSGDRLRPFLGLGLNYTHFTDVKSTTAGNWASGGPTSIEMEDSWGLAAQAGVSWALWGNWALNASVATAMVESDVKATTTLPGGATITRTTTIDFNPVVYIVSVGYRF
jgi:outer membrane protein